MLSKRSTSANDEDIPQLDEGWWSAVLGDEEDVLPYHKEVSTKPAVFVEPVGVDWEKVKTIYDSDEIVSLYVHGFNRGGLLVQGDGVQGFVPVSHLVDMPCTASEDDRRRILNDYVGRTLDLKVIECEQTQERIVLSERAALAGEGQRKQLFQSLKVNESVCGVVTNVTDFGVFVDLGGVEGLIHVSELSWGRVQHPADILKVGQQIQTLVLQISEESTRVALSLKRLYPNPWELLLKRYKPGDVVQGTITSMMRFGVFARLEEGVEGLIHVSSINFPPGVKELDDLVHTGQPVQVRILHIDAERRRLGLGLVSVE
jgi:small subunit ribosomal protein S1